MVPLCIMINRCYRTVIESYIVAFAYVINVNIIQIKRLGLSLTFFICRQRSRSSGESLAHETRIPSESVPVPATAGRQRTRPKHPQYAQLHKRKMSFREKQVPVGQSVADLALAGFFHVGKFFRIFPFQFGQLRGAFVSRSLFFYCFLSLFCHRHALSSCVLGNA